MLSLPVAASRVRDGALSPVALVESALAWIDEPVAPAVALMPLSGRGCSRGLGLTNGRLHSAVRRLLQGCRTAVICGYISHHGVFPMSWRLGYVRFWTRTIEDVAFLLQT